MSSRSIADADHDGGRKLARPRRGLDRALVGPLGLEPRPGGLKGRCEAITPRALGARPRTRTGKLSGLSRATLPICPAALGDPARNRTWICTFGGCRLESIGPRDRGALPGNRNRPARFRRPGCVPARRAWSTLRDSNARSPGSLPAALVPTELRVRTAYPLTQSTCFNSYTTSTRSLCAATTASIGL